MNHLVCARSVRDIVHTPTLSVTCSATQQEHLVLTVKQTHN